MALALALSICKKLGIPIAPHKVHGPQAIMEFLGIILDSIKMELRLPQDKLCRIRAMVNRWSQRKVCTKRELLSLIGHLSHACKVIKPGRPFLRRLIELSTRAQELHHHLRLNVATRSDLGWWKIFLEKWNGVGLMSALSQGTPEIVVTSDASGTWGCGAYWKTQWFSFQWGECWADIHITIKELLPIVIASLIWGKEWQGRRVQFYCDNAAVVAIVNSGRSKHPLAMHYTRLLYLVGAVYNFTFRSSHIAGKLNIAADALSRNQSSTFLQMVPRACPTATTIPKEVEQALCKLSPNWTCESWRGLVSSILTRV